MTANKERMTRLLTFPWESFLMLRLEYVVICVDELEAKMLRIIEDHMESVRKSLYREMLNSMTDDTLEPGALLDVPKDVWVPISYRVFRFDLLDTVKSENTLKRAIKSLIKKNLIFMQYDPTKKYEPPRYQINIPYLQKKLDILKTLGKSGYQKLIPSEIDPLKVPGYQELTPSGYQTLIPSSVSRVSNFDTNCILDSVVDRYVEGGKFHDTPIGGHVSAPEMLSEELQNAISLLTTSGYQILPLMTPPEGSITHDHSTSSSTSPIPDTPGTVSNAPIHSDTTFHEDRPDRNVLVGITEFPVGKCSTQMDSPAPTGSPEPGVPVAITMTHPDNRWDEGSYSQGMTTHTREDDDGSVVCGSLLPAIHELPRGESYSETETVVPPGLVVPDRPAPSGNQLCSTSPVVERDPDEQSCPTSVGVGRDHLRVLPGAPVSDVQTSRLFETASHHHSRGTRTHHLPDAAPGTAAPVVTKKRGGKKLEEQEPPVVSTPPVEKEPSMDARVKSVYDEAETLIREIWDDPEYDLDRQFGKKQPEYTNTAKLLRQEHGITPKGMKLVFQDFKDEEWSDGRAPYLYGPPTYYKFVSEYNTRLSRIRGQGKHQGTPTSQKGRTPRPNRYDPPVMLHGGPEPSEEWLRGYYEDQQKKQEQIERRKAEIRGRTSIAK